MYRYLALVMIGLLAMAGCYKKELRPYSFVNKTNKTVIVDIYNSEADYNTQNNRLSRATLLPGERYDGTGYEQGHTYYFDWYSDDYLYSNWYDTVLANQPNSMEKSFFPTPSTTTFEIKHTDTADYGRLVFLDGNGTETTWRAYDIVTQDGKSIRNKLPDYELVKKIVIRKDHTAEYTAKDSAGNIKTVACRAYDGMRKSTVRMDLTADGRFFYVRPEAVFNDSTVAIVTNKDAVSALYTAPKIGVVTVMYAKQKK